MKAVTLAAATLAVLSTPVLAGGPTIVEPDPMPAVAASVEGHDWSGAYVGLGYGRTSGEMTYSRSTTVFEFDTGATPSIFAGYLFQRGSLVYGAELAYSKGDKATTVGYPSEHLETMLDLKGRLGFAANNALLYGVLGYSQVGYFQGTVGSEDTAGLNYGIGADLALSDRLFVGAEYLVRKTDGDTIGFSPTRDLDLSTVSLRIGLSF